MKNSENEKKTLNKKESLENKKKVEKASETHSKKVDGEKKKEITKKKKELEVEQEEIIEQEEVLVEKETKNTEKAKEFQKSDLFLIVGLVVVVVLGCFLMKGKKEEVQYQLPLTLSGDVGLQLLSYQEYQDKIDQKESFVVVLSRESCSHCASFLPVAEEFAKTNNVPMYYVDTDTFTEEEWNTFEKSNTFLKKNSGKWGTPTTVVLAGKEAVDYVEGETTSEKLLELYQQYFDMNQE